MQRYSTWQALPHSFYSQSLYQDVSQNWRGKGLGYLFIVCIICAIPWLYTAHHFATRIANDLRMVTTQLPEITIKDGVISIDKPMPYEIKEPETNRIIAVINTTQQTNNTQSLIFINKNQLIINTGKNSTKTYALANVKNTVIDQARINFWVKVLIGALFVMLYMFAILFYFLPSLLVTFFYAGLAKLFVKCHHSYTELCRLTAIALTPALVLLTTLTTLNIILPYQNIVYLIVSLGYLTFAIEANKPHEKS